MVLPLGGDPERSDGRMVKSHQVLAQSASTARQPIAPSDDSLVSKIALRSFAFACEMDGPVMIGRNNGMLGMRFGH